MKKLNTLSQFEMTTGDLHAASTQGGRGVTHMRRAGKLGGRKVAIPANCGAGERRGVGLLQLFFLCVCVF